MKRVILIAIFSIGLSLTTFAQNIVSGTVIDPAGNPIKNVLVCRSDDPVVNTFTNEDGAFVLETENCDFIKITKKEVWSKLVKVPEDGVVGKIVLNGLSAIVHMGNTLNTERNETQSTTIITADEIMKNSSFDVKDALLGISPLGIRGVSGSPLLIVDGFPRSWDYLAKEAIESITILKDAAATALWGARGANGVIVVTTKRGDYNSKEITINYSHGVGIPMNLPIMADAATYARALNEALYYDGLPLRYKNSEINLLASGQGDPDIYPNVDWLEEGLRNNTHNNQLNISLRGGGEKIRYFSSTNYKNNFGLLNHEYAKFDDRYSSQIRSYSLSTQMNLDFNVTKSTAVKLSLLGLLSENTKPFSDSNGIFSKLVAVPSAAFPVFTQNGYWGSNNIFNSNPLADIASTGFSKMGQSMLQADLKISQDLSAVLKGLKAGAAIAYDNSATYAESQQKEYLYEVNEKLDDSKNSTVYGEESNLKYSSSLAAQFMETSLQFKLEYDRIFGDHAIKASGMYTQESLTRLGRNNSWKRQYLLGQLSYYLKNRYLFDVVANYYGTSVLKDGDKFRFYSAFSAGWIISDEPFFSSSSIDFLKLRASVGQSAIDNIPYDLEKQFWTYTTGYYLKDANVGQGAIKEGVLPLNELKNATNTEVNFGVDLNMFNKLSFSADVFYKRRDNILVSGSAMYSSVLGIEVPSVFEGITDVKGSEISLSWKEKMRDFSYYVQGNFTFARTEVIENNEGYKPYDYLSAKGKPAGQFFGLEAIGYFNDWEDINNSPQQFFSDVRPGDIKYKDQNNDNIIDQYDVVANGYSTSLPEIYYGIKMGFSYKRFGLDMIWQGVTNYSVVLNTPSVYWPLRNNTNVSNWYLTDKTRWTEETKATANLPRLTTLNNANNFRSSTQWLENGAYISLRNVNLYYNLASSLTKKVNVKELQIYLRGNNLLLFDKLKYLNSENLAVGYPDLRTIHLGVNVKF